MSSRKCLDKCPSNIDNNENESKDEVDFVPIKHRTIRKDDNHNDTHLMRKSTPGTRYGDCGEVKNSLKSSLTTLEKLSFFTLNKKEKKDSKDGATTKHRKHPFVKSASIARLLGNTYNTKKFENELKSFQSGNTNGKFNSNSFPRRIPGSSSSSSVGACSGRFYQRSSSDSENSQKASSDAVSLQDFQDDSRDLGAKAFRTISRGLGKLWWKRTQSVEISTPDPEFKVSYLGNVLTGWAKGDGCVDKPLNTLWRNYTQNNKPDVIMRLRLCASGLKATTRQHGLTEYWANRITHCSAPKNFPRVFCWIYRHEGRKLKHELRCHAVICSKESIAQDICNTLRENLDCALREFKREKILKQNARLSLANAVYDNPSLPRRKILLSVGGNNYRPPMERSKSAPKLMAIEEAIGEEDGEDVEETNEPEMRPCCQKDSLYPAMTLGRRRCRRGHSIRRTGLCKPTIFETFNGKANTKDSNCTKTIVPEAISTTTTSNSKTKSNSSLCSNSDEDDLDKLLSYHDYDTSSPLAGELMSYFDMKLHTKTSSLTDLSAIGGKEEDYSPTLINTDPSPKLRPSLSLDLLDNCSDDGATVEGRKFIEEDVDDEEEDETDELFYRQAAILNLLHRSSLRKMANLSMSSDDSSCLEAGQSKTQNVQTLDSDEGSISSGCETASIATTNLDDTSLKYVQTKPQFVTTITDEIQTNDNQRPNSIQFKLSDEISKSLIPIPRLDRFRDDASDSECSDESGYVEFQELTLRRQGKVPAAVV